jgi:SAM-dependent MidA family methyltransferase
MPVAEFMAACLYDPRHGYYNCRAPFGAAGDFVTAPEISQMFGELIGLWAAAAWRSMGQPDPVALIELGPGRGSMMADALRAARTVPAFRKAVRVHLIETSPDLAMRQRRTLAGIADVMLRWHDTIDEVPERPAIILANEFFDALPVHQAERRPTGWHERVVAINAGGELALTAASAPLAGFEARLPPAVRRAPVGAIFEWREDRFTHDIARRVVAGVAGGARLAGEAGGAALVIDYGHVVSSIGDTFQAVRSHRYVSPLALPGLADLTAHVDFEALARAARQAGARVHGPVEQSTFLKRLGIEARAAVLQRGVPEAERGAIAAALERLIGPGPAGMGTLFKAMAFSSPQIDDLPGFACLAGIRTSEAGNPARRQPPEPWRSRGSRYRTDDSGEPDPPGPERGKGGVRGTLRFGDPARGENQ